MISANKEFDAERFLTDVEAYMGRNKLSSNNVADILLTCPKNMREIFRQRRCTSLSLCIRLAVLCDLSLDSYITYKVFA